MQYHVVGDPSISRSLYEISTQFQPPSYNTLSSLQPVQMHNWEVLVQFSVNGAGKQLFGDGFAFWYTKERNELGKCNSDHQYYLR